ncbi:ATP-binding cassette domain-containing protein [Kineococcus xinjiangensis]|uniref:ATP-binding cassette domain-containing protein n=1 Tax=Kineococcus xinjiangensis TaxID=512762 RepID=UPI000CEC3C01
MRVRGVVKSFDAPVLTGLDLDVATGSLVALLGPSGCGKTTLLRVVAGFEHAEAGTVEVGGRLVEGEGRPVPAERRRVGVVPQEGALFPHLSVHDNVAFGLPRAERAGHRPAELLELVGLAGLGARMPHELSGGQQQRVALARALAPEPSLVLLDEPFSALDAGLRAQVRADVRASLHAAGASAVLVTHDQQEALSTADVVAVVRGGRVVQAGDPWTVYAQPTDLGVATFVGESVVLPGSARSGVVTSALGRHPTGSGVEGPVDVVVRPEQIEVSPADPASVPAVVTHREFYGHDALLRLALPGGVSVTARTPGHPLPDVGATVAVGVRGAVVAFPAAGPAAG